MNILVTGATGFVGRAIIKKLLSHGSHQITALTRKSSSMLAHGVEKIIVDTIDGTTDYKGQLSEFECIIHLAARVHRFKDNHEESYPAYKALNYDGTLHLARHAARSGVKRFIYLSSIKVNGESTSEGHPFRADDIPKPYDSYAKSKYEAECALLSLSTDSSFETVIIRPPLVYGPGVKANFYKLMQLIHKGYPLPFGSIHNLRSLVSLENLVDLISVCIDHPDAANETFLISDGKDISTSDLVKIIAQAMGRPDRQFNIPSSWLNSAAALFGKIDVANRLLGNLQVNIEKTQKILNWQPVITLEDAIKLTTADYLRSTSP
ncbi:MAG: SDR family oxidoreductase [Candidatus Thiodiazotropha sp. (ex Semelilucina semeliformis)]|nr:SDR family oxidoreductase [Candidatus Thiodiazotropha sp. (ex Semelilucina semeliformis)]